VSPTWYPPAWYPDPAGTHEHRWWDGQRWTHHVADAGVAGRDPLPTATGPAPAAEATTGGVARRGSGAPLGRWPLPVALVALVVAATPDIGLVVAGLAAAMAITAVRRRAAAGGPRIGLDTAALAVAALALAVGLLSTIATRVIGGQDPGLLAREQRAIESCLEERSVAECFRESQARLSDTLGR
jgi:hypothetical protein